MTDPTTDPEVGTHQPPLLPAMTLPEYHGRPPIGQTTSVSSFRHKQVGVHSIGDRIVVITSLEVTAAGHDQTKDGIVWAERHKVLDQYEVHGDKGKALLATVRNAYRQSADTAQGRAALADGGLDLGTVGWTDSSGVVLTDAEVAAMRGDDPIRAILDPSRVPAIIVLENERRILWPDELPDIDRPAQGETVNVDGEEWEVIDLLHHATGESMLGLGIADAAAAAEAAARPPVDDATRALVESVETFAVDGLTAHAEALAGDPVDGGWDPGLASVTHIGTDYTGADGLPVVDLVDDVDVAPAAGIPRPDISDDAWDAPGAVNTNRQATADDNRFMDRNAPILFPEIDQIDDVDRLYRLLDAEQGGRGRGLVPRKGVQKHITNRLAVVAGGGAS